MDSESRGSESVALIGAGLAGCLLATLLGRRGIQVTVYERRADPRLAGAERGRSINLALSSRGLDALERVGLRARVLGSALPMPGRMVHPPGAETNFQPYSADGTRAINSISRTELNESLLEVAAATPGVTVRFGHRLTEVDLATGALSFSTPEGGRVEDADVVLGCDGAFSATRSAISFPGGIGVAQDFLEAGYKELTIPESDGEFALDPRALHIWPRGESMMIALPNTDKSFTCTLFWPKNGSGGFDALHTPAQIEAYFRRHYADVAALLPTLVDDYQHNPVGSLVTVRCWPWVAAGEGCQVALVGDAAHAIVPFFGQGANCAFEDCIEIDELLAAHRGGWARALAEYQDNRKANTDVIAELSLDNFIEMRDRVNSRSFRIVSRMQHRLERVLAGRYVSRYELVSFTTMPYSQIPKRIHAQNAIVGAAGAVGAIGLGVLGLAAWRGRRCPGR